jgi:hypothetical protein
MAIKYTFNMSDNDVKKAISSIGSRSKTIRDQMHKVAVSILHNWAENGSVNVAKDRANQMLSECDPAYSQKIVNWFQKYAGFAFENGEFSYVETQLSTETFQAARAESMFELTKDEAPKPMDLRAMILSLAERAEKKRVKGLTEEDVVPDDLVAGLKALVSDDNS